MLFGHVLISMIKKKGLCFGVYARFIFFWKITFFFSVEWPKNYRKGPFFLTFKKQLKIIHIQKTSLLKEIEFYISIELIKTFNFSCITYTYFLKSRKKNSWLFSMIPSLFFIHTKCILINGIILLGIYTYILFQNTVIYIFL